MRRDERAARVGTTAIFFLTGAVFAAWSTRLPAIKQALGLSPGALAVAILGLEAGAIAGLPAGGALVARLGSRAALRLGFAGYPLGLVAVGFAPGVAGLAGALAAMAASNSVVDVAMNAQGVELERRAGRPLLSGMHAGHSFGLVAGSLLGTLAAAAGMPVRAHFALVAAATIAAGAIATRPLVPERRTEREQRFALPRGRLALLGLVAFCGFLLDGTADNWIAVHLRTERGAGPALAAAAFMAYALPLAATRVAGDRLVALFGRANVVRASAIVAAAGATLAVTGPSVATALVGWAVFGAGTAAIAPAVLGAAPAAAPPGVPPGVAIAAVTTVGYLGSFTGPPAIGALAGPLSLDAALGGGALLACAAALVAARAALRGTSGGSAPSRPRA
jgi:MFS family permease